MSRSRASPRRSWHSWGCVEKRCRWYSFQAFLREGRRGEGRREVGGEDGGGGDRIRGREAKRRDGEEKRRRREEGKEGTGEAGKREGDRENNNQKAVVELESFTLNTEY
jgi:hypothetical protein